MRQRTVFVARLSGLLVLLLAFAVVVHLVRFDDPEVESQALAAFKQVPDGTYSVLELSGSQKRDAPGWNIPDDARVGLRPSEARVVHRDTTKAVAAVPASDAPCLATQYRGGSQGLSCAAEPGGTAASVGYDGAIGLVPDSVRAVTFTMSDGTTRAAPVVDNTWTSPVEAARATFVLRGRLVEIDLMPRSSLPEDANISEDGVVTIGDPPEGFGG